MENKKIIIIGAGIAGLSTGCYAAMNGYETAIFEMHDKPGGVCTAWKRKGYIFDYCIHNLAGSGNNAGLKKVWDELRALEGVDIINHDMFVRVESPDGKILNLYTDLDRLEKHLITIAPEDKANIKKYINTCRSISKADLFAAPLGEKKSIAGMLLRLPSVMKWSKTMMDEYTLNFSNPFLRRTFPHLQYNVKGEEAPMLPHFIFMGGFDKKDLGWPYGGSLEFSKRIADQFTSSGGVINYKTPVAEILTNNGHAVGIKTTGGTEHYADIIISAADGYTTIYEMLHGKYTNDIIDSYYRDYPENQAFGLQVYLGLNRDLSGEPHALTLLLDEPLYMEGTERDSVYIEIFDSTTGLAPVNKSIIKVVMDGNYDHWNNLRSNMNEYRAAKEEVKEKIIKILENRFPGIKDQVETADVTTPVTAYRYTKNFHGLQPWAASSGGGKIMLKGLSKTLPGLDNFYMVGQWAGAIVGVSTAAVSGRNLVKNLCKKHNKPFKTSTKT